MCSFVSKEGLSSCLRMFQKKSASKDWYWTNGVTSPTTQLNKGLSKKGIYIKLFVLAWPSWYHVWVHFSFSETLLVKGDRKWREGSLLVGKMLFNREKTHRIYGPVTWRSHDGLVIKLGKQGMSTCVCVFVYKAISLIHQYGRKNLKLCREGWK